MTQLRVLKFSPVPEFIDPVNVAVIVSDRTTDMHFYPDFRRLRCVAPSFDTEALEFMLQELSDRLSDTPADHLDVGLYQWSGQFSLSEPHKLESKVGQRELQALMHSYLQPAGTRQRRHVDAGSNYITTRLGDFVEDRLRIPQRLVLKQAAPKNFLSQPAVDVIGPNGFKISRVVRGSQGIILVDGIDLSMRRRQNIERRTDRVAYSYFKVSKFREQLESIEKRWIKRVSLVFSMDQLGRDSHFEYYVNTLERESDFLVDTDNSRDVEKLIETASGVEPQLLR